MESYLRTIFEFSKSIFATADIKELLPVIEDLVIKETNAERCRVVLYSDEAEQIENIGRVVSDDDVRNEGFESPISKKVIQTVWQSNEVLVSANAMDDERFGKLGLNDSIMIQKLKSVACAPLIHKKRPFGVIYIDNRKKKAVFTKKNGELLRGLAELIAEALKNSLQTTLRRQQVVEERLLGYDEILGSSPAMQQVYEEIEKVKDFNVNVLITGPTGIGKELVARALHRKSNRANKPFVKVDCSTIPDNLLESELFGIEEKVATDVAPRIGFFEKADGGTLFIDEIGNINIRVQKLLLQFIDLKQFIPVGAREPKTSNVRILFATNKNLLALISKNEFMDDLYERIVWVEIKLPPLSERGNDILLIAEDFLTKKNEEFKKNVRGFTEESEQWLLSYSFPGNVRSLQRIVTRALLNAKSDYIQVEDIVKSEPSSFENTIGVKKFKAKSSQEIYSRYLPEEYQNSQFISGISEKEDDPAIPAKFQLHENVLLSVDDAENIPLKEATSAASNAFERNYIIMRLMISDGNLSKAADQCVVDRKTLSQKLSFHGLRREWYKR